MTLPTFTLAGTILNPDNTPVTSTITMVLTAPIVDAVGNVLHPQTKITAQVVAGVLKGADGTDPLDDLVFSDAGSGVIPYLIHENFGALRTFTANLTQDMAVAGVIAYAPLGPTFPPPTPSQNFWTSDEVAAEIGVETARAETEETTLAGAIISEATARAAGDTAEAVARTAAIAAQHTADNAAFVAKVTGNSGQVYGVKGDGTTGLMGVGRTYDIREFVEAGQNLVSDGSSPGDNFTIFHQAVVALAAGTKPRQIYVPDGDYDLGTGGQLTWHSLIGIKGESEAGTRIIAPSDGCALYSGLGSLGAPLTDCQFEDFTIDCLNQTSGSYTTTLKGMWLSYMLRPVWRRVAINNAWATGFGCDFLIDYAFDHVTAIGNGRGITSRSIDPDTVSGGAGIGIGTGMSQVENGVITSPLLLNNGRAGLFHEQQTGAGATYWVRGVKVTGGLSSGNWIGLHDCGCDGLESTMAVTDNLRAGVLLDVSTLAPQAGFNGRINSENARNGLSAAGKVAGGVVIGNAPAGHYKFEGTNHDNQVGVISTPTSTLGPNVCFDADVWRSKGSGYLIQGTSATPVKAMRISRYSRANGQDNTQTYRDGVTILVASTLLDLSARCIDDQATKTQQYGVQTLGAGLSLNQANLTGDVRANAAGSWNNQQTVSNDSNQAFVGADTSNPSALVVSSTQSSGGGAVALSWSPPIPATSVTDYAIQYRTSNVGSGAGSWTTFTHSASTSTTNTVTGLTDGVSYDFQVAKVVSGTTGSYTAGPASGTPTQLPLYSDTFQRASASTLGSTDGGTASTTAWTVTGSATTWGIITSNKARPTAGGLTNAYIDTTHSGGTHQVTVAGLNVAAAGGLGFRIQDESNLLFLALKKTGSSSNDYAIQKRVAGTVTSLLDLAVTPAAGDILKIVDNPGTNQIRAYINGVLKGTVTDATFAGNTKAGLHGAFTSDGSSGWSYWSYKTEFV